MWKVINSNKWRSTKRGKQHHRTTPQNSFYDTGYLKHEENLNIDNNKENYLIKS